ncbi:hypothetical protein O181_051285 [Austropuccinia psidii MF-1]|uniref:Uncharacterized protein n=1 Tax=Austropuccinia psidii MF-1 TaxID=1389203 RepID=A0A9Q3HRN5_9BASI|nr:hypothetical protein [Austropuccinia psidii MF-1]
MLDQLASHPGNFDSLQGLMEISLELSPRYHERKKEEGSLQENKPPVTGSHSFKPPQDSPSKKPHNKKNFQVSEDNPHFSLLNKDNKEIRY